MSGNLYSTLARNSGVPRGDVNKGNGFSLAGCPDWELRSTISSEMTDFLDDISVYQEELKSADSDLMKFQFRYWNLGRKRETTTKGKQRSANNRRTKQSNQPKVNSSEATSTRNSNENAKMQANHSRNQNRKAAEVLTKKGLESKLRSMGQNFVSEQL